MSNNDQANTDDAGYKWGLRIPVVIMSIFLFVAPLEIIARFAVWLSFCFMTSVTMWVALLILCVFSEFRVFTFVAMFIVSILAGFVLLFRFGILLKSEMPYMGPIVGLIPPHLAWLVFGPLMAIVKDWTLLVALGIWLVMIVSSYQLTMRHPEYGNGQ